MAAMEYNEILKYIRDGNEDGAEYVLEWIPENSTDPDTIELVLAVFSARDREESEDE
jgi:hypothetical protein